MSETATIRGTSYAIPETGETEWGAVVSSFLAAIPTNAILPIPFGNATVPTPGPAYLRPVYSELVADGTELFMVCPADGWVTSVVVHMLGAPEDGGPEATPCVTFTLRVNGADSTVVSEGSNTRNNSTPTAGSAPVQVSAGNLLSIAYAETTALTVPPQGIYATALLDME